MHYDRIYGMNELVLITILLILVATGIFINLKILSRIKEEDTDNKGDQLLELQEKLDSQKHKLDDQLTSIRALSEGLSEFNYPLKQITRYLSGGTLAGTFGEWGLGAIVRDILPVNKIKENYEIKKGSNQRVEFAIDLNEGFLSIDAKFPQALYDTYIDAAEKHHKTGKSEVDKALNAIKTNVKDNAKDINEKYMQKGITLDFAVMFIPSESLMQLIDRLKDENIKRSTKEQIFRDYRVLILGPNSLAAFLITLNMGFKSIVLNERAEEILNIFGKFEKEFRLFQLSTIDVRNKANNVITEIDQNEVRVRAMERVIKEMDELTHEDK
jgi:DNA recombination protein RmuC